MGAQLDLGLWEQSLLDAAADVGSKVLLRRGRWCGASFSSLVALDSWLRIALGSVFDVVAVS